MKKILISFLSCLLINIHATAQSYHAINGSSYAGVLGIDNNPASIVNSDLAWDVNLFSFQTKYSTNAVQVLNYSLLSSAAKSQYRVVGGNFSRYGVMNLNMHLVNARIAIDRRQSVAFGVNLKSYSYAQTSRYNFSDTIARLRQFLAINEDNPVLGGNLKSSTWFEYFGAYSRIILEEETHRLQAGITVKATRGVSGAYVNAKDAGATRIVQANRASYVLKNGTAEYGYSAGFDQWKNDQGTSANLQQFLAASRTSLSLDVGIEYLVKRQVVTNYYDNDNYYDYEWKIGAALLDIGRAQYEYGANSRLLSLPKASVSDQSLNNKFISIHDADEFNDSISTVFNNVQALTGRFSVINPARLVLNVDRVLGNDFFVNAELSLNLSAAVGREKLYATELNLLALTPRWETRRWGVYLPILYNTQKQFWVGGAFKAGPVLLGLHNWANIFSKNKMQNGGGYLAFVIRPGSKIRRHRDKRFDCPR